MVTASTCESLNRSMCPPVPLRSSSPLPASGRGAGGERSSSPPAEAQTSPPNPPPRFGRGSFLRPAAEFSQEPEVRPDDGRGAQPVVPHPALGRRLLHQPG